MQDDKIVNSSTENPLKNENIDNVLSPKLKYHISARENRISFWRFYFQCFRCNINDIS